MPKRLVGTALILIFVGLIPFAFSLIHVSLPSPAPLLNLLLPPHVAQWLVDYVSFKGIAVLGGALLLLAAILVVRRIWEEHFNDGPMGTSEVLLEEAKAIHGKEADASLLEIISKFYARPERQQELSEAVGEQDLGRDRVSNVSPSVFQWLNGVDPKGRTALCLSGGGIRSASFGLGVLQALAMHPRARTLEGAQGRPSPEKSYLAQFNYLSTVSGGGYIGGWFSTWVQRVGYANVWRDLARIGDREQDPGEQAAPLKWLRVHSNFLTPKLGLSGDTLAGDCDLSSQSSPELARSSSGAVRRADFHEADGARSIQTMGGALGGALRGDDVADLALPASCGVVVHAAQSSEPDLRPEKTGKRSRPPFAGPASLHCRRDLVHAFPGVERRASEYVQGRIGIEAVLLE